MSGPRLIRVWADTVRKGTCRSEKCGASITFAQTVNTGKHMPFDGELVALATEHEPETRRVIYSVDFETSHFRTCPDANRFSARGRS